ncbi:nucleoside hydrolase-like domain-containing protein [Jiangella endophytica]|uniref:nucleoside hydrolase-like domain-containing protein n=1 Tax=Jiangella endophytica TaxID=1623398 RepID=UPI0018E5546B|nr:nucleoside hydrolase-like domain-containing protein [Jiangella endophytica]
MKPRTGLALLAATALTSSFVITVAASGSADPGIAPPATAVQPDRDRPRVIAMTDGEIDDWSTMMRFLLYSSDYDVAGIVETNSQFQPVGHSGESWLEDEIDAYEEVYPNLIVHHPDYPTPDYLRSVSVVGNETRTDLILAPDQMTTRDTDGERLIIDRLLDDDPRPILFGAWGGANTLAQALWTIRNEHSQADWDKAVAKTRIYAIWYQDNGGRWIEENYPEIQIFEAFRWDMAWNYRVLQGPAPDWIKEMMDTPWLYENIKSNHGPLGEFYPQEYTSEGDTPAFIGAVGNGLGDDFAYADFTLGGWGGRGELDEPYLLPHHYTDRYTIADDGDAHKQYWRWLPAIQNDWAARADWMVTPAYEDANHQPVVRAKGATRTVAQPGDVFTLDLRKSSDPDGDELSFDFWHYGDQDSVSADVPVSQDGSGRASIVIPDEPGTQIQIIGEVTDDGDPALTTYQRYLIDIGTEYVKTPAERPADSIDWSEPAAISGDGDVSTNGTLVKAVDLTAGEPAASVTVNGVEFMGSPYVAGTTTLAGGDTMYATDSAPISGQLNRVLAGATSLLGGTGLQPFAGLSQDYRELLRTGFYNDADESVADVRLGNYSIPERYTERAGYDLTLTDLTPGTEYEIQLFVNDDSTRRIGTSPNLRLTTIVRDQGGEASLRHNAAGVDGSPGQYVTGRFTATETTKVIQLVGGPGKGGTDQRSALLNAYQLRQVEDDPGGDACPDGHSPSGTVVLGDVDSGVANHERPDGCTLLDLIFAAEPFTNHGAFVRHVQHITTQFVDDGLLTVRERSRIVRAAGNSDVGR